MASRILGMGDVLTLVEKAESVFEEDEAPPPFDRLFDQPWHQVTAPSLLEEGQEFRSQLAHEQPRKGRHPGGPPMPARAFGIRDGGYGCRADTIRPPSNGTLDRWLYPYV